MSQSCAGVVNLNICRLLTALVVAKGKAGGVIVVAASELVGLL